MNLTINDKYRRLFMEVYVEKGFNWKKFFKIVGIVVGSIVGLFLVLFLFHRIEGTIRGGKITKYEVWKSSTVEKVAEYCDLDLEKVEKVELYFYNPLENKIGYLENNFNYDSVEYFIYDKEIIKELISRLSDVKMYGVNDGFDYYEEVTYNWKLKIVVEDVEYAMTLTGGSVSGQDKAELLNVDVQHRDTPVVYDTYPNTAVCTWAEDSLIYGESLNDYIFELYEKQIKDIKVEDVLVLKDDGNLDKFLSYENSGAKGKSYKEQLKDEHHTLVYELRMADFDGYIIVEKESESISNSEQTGTVFNDVTAVTIYKNNSEESIDFMNSSKAQIEEFLK